MALQHFCPSVVFLLMFCIPSSLSSFLLHLLMLCISHPLLFALTLTVENAEGAHVKATLPGAHFPIGMFACSPI